jgi:plastocyanin
VVVVRRPLVSLALLACVAATGCGKQHGAEEAHPIAGSVDQAVTIDAHDFAFRPHNITVDAHGDLVLTVENRGRATHTFTTDTPKMDVVLQPGDRRTVRLPTTAALRFYCRFHESDGMRGVVCLRTGDCTNPL